MPHLELLLAVAAEFRPEVGDPVVEVKPALFDQAEKCGDGKPLSRREDGENRIGLHPAGAVGIGPAGPFVQDLFAVEIDRQLAAELLSGGDRLIEQLPDLPAELREWNHCSSPVEVQRSCSVP